MNRRELFKSSLGLPLAMTGLGAASAASGRIVVLKASAVSRDLSIFDSGDGPCFSCTLYQHPWPCVGDRIQFDFKSTHLEGTVTATDAEALVPNRWAFKIRGTVQVFTAASAKDEK